MKKLITLLAFSFTLAACSSGSSVSEVPPNLSGVYVGTFSNNDGNDSGTIRLNLSQAENATSVSGIATILDSGCLQNGPVSGSMTGFSVSLTIPQDGGDMLIQATASGNSLSGNYIVELDEVAATPTVTEEDSSTTESTTLGKVCSIGSGAGTLTLTR